MRKLLFCIILLISGISCRESNRDKQYADYSKSSGFEAGEIDGILIDNLFVLGKVWGYVKYHHPVSAGSEINMDFELFELLPRIAYADKENRNSILFKWIKGLGRFKSSHQYYKETEESPDYSLLAELGWLEDTDMLGTALSRKLKDLRYAERVYNKYVTPSKYLLSVPDFSAEKKYQDLPSVDHGYALLGLFRFWNIIEYYFPYRNIIDRDWNGVLREYAEVFVSGVPCDRSHYYKSMAKLVAEINDTHSYFPVGYIFGNRYIPLAPRFVEGKLIISSDDFGNLGKLNLSVGDEILNVDGIPVDSIKNKVAAYVSCSNEASLRKATAQYAMNTHKNKAELGIKRNGKTITAVTETIDYHACSKIQERLDAKIKEEKTYKLLDDGNIGYIYAANYFNKDADSLMRRFAGTKGIIVDIRCYPSDFMIFDFIGKYFMPKRTQNVVFTKSNKLLPGTYCADKAFSGMKNKDYYKGKIVVLSDEYAISQAEYTIMTFQAAPDCIVIGSQTAGADGNVAAIPLPGELDTRASFLGVFYPDMTPTQRTGIRIDEYVEPTVHGVKAGRDEVLERAIRIINSQGDTRQSARP